MSLETCCTCGQQQTQTRCDECDRPLCARCSEPRWMEDLSETCSECVARLLAGEPTAQELAPPPDEP